MTASDKTKDGWTLQGEHEWDECSVQFSGSGCYHTIYEPGRRLPIAFVIGSSEYWRDGEAEDTARARLIAAAPDGLAFAQHYDAYMSANYSEGPSSSALHPTAAETWRLARSFIAKATGDA